MDREPHEFDGRNAQAKPVAPRERLGEPSHEPARELESVPPGSRNYRSQPSRPGRPRPHDQPIRDREDRPQREPERDRPRAAGHASISDRERNLLAEIGRFRVIRAADLREPFFDGNNRAMAETLAKLRSTGLIEDHLIRRRAGGNAPDPEKVRLISLTREG